MRKFCKCDLKILCNKLGWRVHVSIVSSTTICAFYMYMPYSKTDQSKRSTLIANAA